MFLALDSDEREIADAAADFLGNEFPLRRLHETPEDPDNLAAFAGLGWLGLAAAEGAGGSALSVVEEMLFFQEHGRVAGPMEVLFQVLAVAVTQDDEALCASLIAGEATTALLVQQGAAGEIRLVGSADAKFALRVQHDGAVLYSVNAAELRKVPCLDRSVAMYMGSETCLESRVAVGGSAVWQRALIAVAAMQVGLADSALQMIVAYAKERETFGRAIGSYQAVRHPCSDMAVRVEAARSQLFYAATALREGHADAAMQVDAAKLLADKAATLNTDANIQLHGGIGVTDELDAHLLLKRANLLGRLFGSSKQLYGSLLDLDTDQGGV
ncbi:acyl-CoA dehydrogenase family protein [Haliea sp. E17]|uniref:acyl-CoA dehydrogenase family protein n=1 Tax=Haliea sp. E17 TaxID=3401576 RepID=UPI003AAC959D